jgi:AP2-like factor (euAP2 lineage)
MLIPLCALDGTVRAEAVVDAEDAAWARWRWSLGRGGYAIRTVRLADRRTYSLSLHRAIMGLQRGDPRQVDHINGDVLDCRRSNLRIVPGQAANRQNVRSRRGSTSSYRGVSWDKRTKSWRAVVKVDGATYWLGRYADEEEAAAVTASFRAVHVPYSVEGR